MREIKKHFPAFVIAILGLGTFFIWQAVFSAERNGVLTVAFLDIGQGDAIFIEAPNGNQVLIDGGPNKKILSALADVMPPYDRSIDVIIATHPDKDHIGGLPAVLERFDVTLVVEPGIENDTNIYTAFVQRMNAEGADIALARRGMRIVLDEDVVLEILYPDRDVTHVDPNEGSVVAKLLYGESNFMFTGDAPRDVERHLVALDGALLRSEVLKLGHHGSKTSSDGAFLSAVAPEYAVVSAGKDNSYGHPHEEVVARVKEFGAELLNTYDKGTIIFKTDGKLIRLEN